MAAIASCLPFLLYIAFGRAVICLSRGWSRQIIFALLNIAALWWFFVAGKDIRYFHAFLLYVGLVVLQYITLRLFGKQEHWKPWIAFALPILFLFLIRYVPVSLYARWNGGLRHALDVDPNFSLSSYFIGISYLAFRTSHLALEIRNGAAGMPNLWEYLGFSFFLPTLPVGPISPYNKFQEAFSNAPPVVAVDRAVLRILVGLVKYRFVGSIFDQLSYGGLLHDGYNHHWVDLPVAVVFYYLFLYCNFSGFCDMAIGAAGLMGIPVAENFNNPFAARNVRDFWNRWHITLSVYMRDVVFSPLSKFLVRLFGFARANHAIAVAIVVVFLLVGIWHGVGWNFAAYGAVHALGVVVNHYYTIGLKIWLGRDGFKAYNVNPWIRAGAISLTFCYCAASLLFFANTLAEIQGIFASLK